MKLRWILCILISLAIHIAWLNHTNLTQKLSSKFTVPLVVVADAEPAPPPPARPTPQPQPQQLENITKTQPQKFRPNIEHERENPEENQTQEVADKSPQTEEDKPDNTEMAKGELPKTAQENKPDAKDDIAKYRKQLLDEFKNEWQKVPELNTVIRDLTILPKIDSHFGIVILAYSFVDHKPGPPFVIFNTNESTFQQIDNFNFSSFSNRIKDRMLYTQYRRLLEKARQEYKINSIMKVIGLVPTETDRYFSAKQLRAVQLAGLKLEQVAATNGHYEPDGSGGFNLIIDTVQTTTGRTIPIQDEELKFSVVAKKYQKGRY